MAPQLRARCVLDALMAQCHTVIVHMHLHAYSRSGHRRAAGSAAQRGPRTGVHAGLLDVLHNAADDDVAVLVAQRVHVQLVRAVQVLVDQHRAVGVHLYRVLDVALQVRVAAGARLAWKAEYLLGGVSTLYWPPSQ